jgi:hypothetical protein
MQELVFPVEQEKDGSFVARATDKSVLVRAESVQELRTKIMAAIRLTLPRGTHVRVRFQFGNVRTLSLIGYLAAIYAWLLELSVLLLHTFTKAKLGTPSQVILLALVMLLSAFAWHRREDFRSLRHWRGRIPLTTSQSFIVAAFVIGLGLLGSLVAILAANQ